MSRLFVSFIALCLVLITHATNKTTGLQNHDVIHADSEEKDDLEQIAVDKSDQGSHSNKSVREQDADSHANHQRVADSHAGQSIGHESHGAAHHGLHGNDAYAEDDDFHGNESHGNHSHGHKHHGIHVVTVDFNYVKQPLILIVFMFAVAICKIGFHKAECLSKWIPESCLLIILGTVVGVILHVTKADKSDFYYIDPPKFFLFLLPPCILEASYSLHDTVFFENVGTILVYAVLGTILNCFIIAPALYGLALIGAMGELSISLIECLVFGSFIVAVDPVAVLAIFQEVGVNSVLYFVVFGESLLNDAVTVVLYKTITTLAATPGAIPISEILMGVAAFFTVSLGGFSIGILMGIVSGLVTRFTHHITAIESLTIFSLAYGAYLLAELFHFSGIISMIGCGLVQMQYSFHNISHNSVTTVKYFVKMLSGACESIIFMFLGISLVNDSHNWNTGFVLWTAFLCLAVRFAGTFFLTFIANKLYRGRKIDLQEQFIMAYGGLRGAVAFCLVAMLDTETIAPSMKNMFQTATHFVIIFTVFVQGISVKPIVKLLKIRSGEDKVLSMSQEINSQMIDHIMVFMEEVVGQLGQNRLKDKIYKLDQKYLKPILQRDPFTKDQEIVQLFQDILMHQDYKDLHGRDSLSSSCALLPTYNLVRVDDTQDGVIGERKRVRRISGHKLGSVARALIAAQRAHGGRPSSTYSTHSSDRDDFSALHALTVSAQMESRRPSIKGLFPVTEGVVAGQGKQQQLQPAPDRLKARRGSMFPRLRGGSVQTDDVAAEQLPTVKDLKKWLVKTASKDVYQRLNDNNGPEIDIVSRLHEVQRRQERLQRHLSGGMYSGGNTPYNGRSRSCSVDYAAEIAIQLGPRALFKSNTAGRVDITPAMIAAGGGFKNKSTPDDVGDDVEGKAGDYRQRHRTVELEGPQGHVKYTPRFQKQGRSMSLDPEAGHKSLHAGSSTALKGSSTLRVINEDAKGDNSTLVSTVPTIMVTGISDSNIASNTQVDSKPADFKVSANEQVSVKSADFNMSFTTPTNPKATASKIGSSGITASPKITDSKITASTPTISTTTDSKLGEITSGTSKATDKIDSPAPAISKTADGKIAARQIDFKTKRSSEISKPDECVSLLSKPDEKQPTTTTAATTTAATTTAKTSSGGAKPEKASEKKV